MPSGAFRRLAGVFPPRRHGHRRPELGARRGARSLCDHRKIRSMRSADAFDTWLQPVKRSHVPDLADSPDVRHGTKIHRRRKDIRDYALTLRNDARPSGSAEGVGRSSRGAECAPAFRATGRASRAAPRATETTPGTSASPCSARTSNAIFFMRCQIPMGRAADDVASDLERNRSPIDQHADRLEAKRQDGRRLVVPRAERMKVSGRDSDRQRMDQAERVRERRVLERADQLDGGRIAPLRAQLPELVDTDQGRDDDDDAGEGGAERGDGFPAHAASFRRGDQGTRNHRTPSKARTSAATP
jgi:hypothetical protein